MAQNTENIEAKLCDYIEGQLDEAGRAEIERHLESNPQHRALLRELMQTRDLVRALPREKAPAEILESLQGQLERSVLLDPHDEEQPDLVLHVRRLPQIMAIAAMLLLAVALAAVIYFVLPPSGVNQPDFAAVDPSAVPDDAEPPVIDLSPDSVASVAPRSVPDSSDFREPRESASPLAPTHALPGPESVTLSLEPQQWPIPGSLVDVQTIRNVFDVGGDRASISTPARPEAETAAQNRLFVVVASPDPTAANRDVAEYLTNNRMRWQSMPEPMPPPLDIQRVQQVVADRLRNQEMVLKKDENQASAPYATADAASQTAENTRSEGARPAEAGEFAQRMNPPRPTTGGMSVAVAPPSTPRDDARRMDARLYSVPPTRDPSGLDDKFVQVDPDELTLQKPPAQQKVEAEQYIVVGQMTKRQAAELSNSLSRKRAGQRAEMIEEKVLPGAEQEYLDLVLTGDPESAHAVGPATRPSTRPAAPEAASRGTAGSLTTVPSSTQPIAAATVPDPVPATQPAGAASAVPPAATQPLAEGLVEHDTPVDVVIVVQDIAALHSATPEPPATQPQLDNPFHLEPEMP